MILSNRASSTCETDSSTCTATDTFQTAELNVYFENLEHRVLWLDKEIDESLFQFEKLIVLWNIQDMGLAAKERKPIVMFINSCGGELDYAYSLISTIKASKTPVYAVNMGQCYSSACYIYLACHKRFAIDHSSFLIHKCSMLAFGGTHSQVVADYSKYSSDIDWLFAFIEQHSAIPGELLKQNIETEWYFNENDAVALGVCDQKLSTIEDVFFGDAYAER